MISEAIEKITGSLPAFTRPRALLTCVSPKNDLSFARLIAYGSYDDLVREVADSRGQVLVNWDFE
jgi:hypothetical protein